MNKPRVFVASAVESLDVADAVNVSLDHDAEVMVWKSGFELSTDSISNLVSKASSFDFAIFVFTPDDVVRIRKQTRAAVRDNVLFELGLFVGLLGVKRCFILKPRNTDLHIPSDLLAMTPAEYDATREDGDLSAAVNAPCARIRKQIAEAGRLPRRAAATPDQRRIPKYDYPIGEAERSVLATLTKGHVSDTEGSLPWQIINSARNIGEAAVSLGILKLERIGLVERTIVAGMNEPYFTYALTAEGVDYVLEHDVAEASEPAPEKEADPYNDDIPF